MPHGVEVQIFTQWEHHPAISMVSHTQACRAATSGAGDIAGRRFRHCHLKKSLENRVKFDGNRSASDPERGQNFVPSQNDWDFTKPMKNMYTAYMFNILSNKKKVCSINGGHAKRALDGDYFMEKPSMGGDLPQPGLSVAVVQGLLQLVKA